MRIGMHPSAAMTYSNFLLDLHSGKGQDVAIKAEQGDLNELHFVWPADDAIVMLRCKSAKLFCGSEAIQANQRQEPVLARSDSY